MRIISCMCFPDQLCWCTAVQFVCLWVGGCVHNCTCGAKHSTCIFKLDNVHTVFKLDAPDVHTTCTQRAHCVHTTCTQRAHDVHTACTRRAHSVHTTGPKHTAPAVVDAGPRCKRLTYIYVRANVCVCVCVFMCTCKGPLYAPIHITAAQSRQLIN